jgi:hypothetical protein
MGMARRARDAATATERAIRRPDGISHPPRRGKIADYPEIAPPNGWNRYVAVGVDDAGAGSAAGLIMG